MPNFQSSITGALNTVAQVAVVKPLTQKLKEEQSLSGALEKIQAGEDVDIETVPEAKREQVKQAQETQREIDIATANVALETAKRLQGVPTQAERFKNLVQRQQDIDNSKKAKQRILDLIYPKGGQ